MKLTLSTEQMIQMIKALAAYCREHKPTSTKLDTKALFSEVGSRISFLYRLHGLVFPNERRSQQRLDSLHDLLAKSLVSARRLDPMSKEMKYLLGPYVQRAWQGDLLDDLTEVEITRQHANKSAEEFAAAEKLSKPLLSPEQLVMTEIEQRTSILAHFYEASEIKAAIDAVSVIVRKEACHLSQLRARKMEEHNDVVKASFQELQARTDLETDFTVLIGEGRNNPGIEKPTLEDARAMYRARQTALADERTKDHEEVMPRLSKKEWSDFAKTPLAIVSMIRDGYYEWLFDSIEDRLRGARPTVLTTSAGYLSSIHMDTTTSFKTIWQTCSHALYFSWPSSAKNLRILSITGSLSLLSCIQRLDGLHLNLLRPDDALEMPPGCLYIVASLTSGVSVGYFHQPKGDDWSMNLDSMTRAVNFIADQTGERKSSCIIAKDICDLTGKSCKQWQDDSDGADFAQVLLHSIKKPLAIISSHLIAGDVEQ